MTKLSWKSLTLLYVALSVFGVVMLFPFYWMIVVSLSSAADMSRLPPVFYPVSFHWENYVRILVENNFFHIAFNSAFVTVFDIIGTLLSCAIIGYGFAMFEFKGKKLLFMGMLSTLMLPGQVTLIPHFYIWKELHTLNSYYPLILPSFLGKAFGILLMHQHFKTLPRDLYESAYVDGANPFKIFYRIYAPLSKPVLATLAIFTFLGSWNDTLHPLIYLNDAAKFTLPLALLIMKGNQEIDLTLDMAGSVITVLPAAIIFLFGQRYFIEGVARAGLKG